MPQACPIWTTELAEAGVGEAGVSTVVDGACKEKLDGGAVDPGVDDVAVDLETDF
jgi:hypothetical protein